MTIAEAYKAAQTADDAFEAAIKAAGFKSRWDWDSRMRTLDLLRNHTWNAQAVIGYYEANDEKSLFTVKIEAIEGFSLDKLTYHADRDEAYKHAHMVIFGNLDGYVPRAA